MADGALQRLTAAADAIVASPLPLTDDRAREFLQAHPLEEVFRYTFACLHDGKRCRKGVVFSADRAGRQ